MLCVKRHGATPSEAKSEIYLETSGVVDYDTLCHGVTEPVASLMASFWVLTAFLFWDAGWMKGLRERIEFTLL